jgi:hypothetical protein
MKIDSEIIVVSGLPRSGTSLMMQMLDAGGIEVITDHVRTADVDNPRGYFELEQAKQVQRDTSWLPQARGKAFKMVSQLLYHLPPTERYRIIFMRRALDEMLASQKKMLQRRNAAAAPRDEIKEAYTLHLATLFEWLIGQTNMEVLIVSYNRLLDDPFRLSEEVSQFLGGRPAVEAMAHAVEPGLYRNRSTPTQV